MFKTKLAQHSIKRVGSGLVGIAIGLAAVFAPTVAMADTVGWLRISGNELRIILPDGTQYFAYTAFEPTNCFHVSSDTFKEWASLAQAALLSGKNIGIASVKCGTLNVINNIEIAQ